MTCSIVWIRILPLERVVERVVSLTFSTRASISGRPSRSVRRKRIPLFGGAGRNVILTPLPLCRPTPSKLTVSRRVCCCGTETFNNDDRTLGKLGRRGMARKGLQISPWVRLHIVPPHSCPLPRGEGEPCSGFGKFRARQLPHRHREKRIFGCYSLSLRERVRLRGG